ncbi:hypothetical protein EV175_007257 [Coemansia sp. RSA 1933]|nr:hypothetical protein EV175_007257 [Coemansia sp. RSA 1933]
MEAKEGTIYTVIVKANHIDSSIGQHQIIGDVRKWLERKGYDFTEDNGVSETFSRREDDTLRYILFGRGLGMDRSPYATGQRCVTIRARYNSEGKLKGVFYNHRPYLKRMEQDSPSRKNAFAKY